MREGAHPTRTEASLWLRPNDQRRRGGLFRGIAAACRRGRRTAATGRLEFQRFSQRTNRIVTISVTVVTFPSHVGGNRRFAPERIRSSATVSRRTSREMTRIASTVGIFTGAGNDGTARKRYELIRRS